MAEAKDAAAVASKANKEIAELDLLNSQPFFQSAYGYIKRTGPGLLQSAMTLGAGSAAASVLAGASFGYKLLWVQPVAMFLGVMMLAALSNVVLTKGERPITSFSREMGTFGKFIVFFWIVGTIMSSMIWHFPQYGLAAAAARDLANNLGDVAVAAPPEEAANTVMGLGFTGRVWPSVSSWASRSCVSTSSPPSTTVAIPRACGFYEWFLRGCIALVVVMFGIVVVAKVG